MKANTKSHHLFRPLFKMWSIFVLIILFHYSQSQVANPIVTTPNGQVQGAQYTSRVDTNFTFYGFKGVPFGQDPVGPLRFQAPQPALPWTGILDGTKPGTPCSQVLDLVLYLGGEECLNLDVYTPELPGNGTALKPVMYWLTGGGYIFGGSFIYGPDSLILHDVVIVVTNYRLGALGFLSTGDENAWGNNGLKDQVAGLEWIRDNIALFGGDPNRVTIFGQSAGASSVSYLQVSPLATGLFHQVIAHSGCAVNSWAVQREPLRWTINFKNYFNISSDATVDIVNGLQLIDAKTLTMAGLNPIATGHSDPLEIPPFYPIIEPVHPGALVTIPAIDSFVNGNYNQVPFFYGHTTAEGAVRMDSFLASYNLTDFDQRPELIVSPSLNNPADPVSCGREVMDFFVGVGVPAADNFDGFLSLFSNELFVRGMRKAVDLQRNYVNGYFYRFSYEVSFGMGYPGVDHAEDLQFYWYMPNADYASFTPADVLTMQRASKIFTNFAKFGNPTPVADPLFDGLMWPAVTPTEIGFVDIGANLVPGNLPNETEYLFWDHIFTTYGNPPFQTY